MKRPTINLWPRWTKIQNSELSYGARHWHQEERKYVWFMRSSWSGSKNWYSLVSFICFTNCELFCVDRCMEKVIKLAGAPEYSEYRWALLAAGTGVELGIAECIFQRWLLSPILFCKVPFPRSGNLSPYPGLGFSSFLDFYKVVEVTLSFLRPNHEKSFSSPWASLKKEHCNTAEMLLWGLQGTSITEKPWLSVHVGSPG